MEIQVNSARSVGIYFADPSLREQLFRQLERQCSNFAVGFSVIEDLDTVGHDLGVELLLVALSEDGVQQSTGDNGAKGQKGKGEGGIGGSDNGEIEGILGFLESLKQRFGRGEFG